MKDTVHNGKYRLIEKRGAGATSIVYKAERVSDGKIVAVKVLRSEYVSDADTVKRFMREADALLKLDHPNIVNVFDYGNEDDTFYIVMEYIEGETLKKVIKSSGGLPEDTVLVIALQLCAALKQAHDSGIIHRDIKPQNILITTQGTVKIADFGIARLNTQSTMTAFGKDVLGSVHYISPEQARGGYLDKRTDIYSFGVTLYEMACGVLPFTGEDPLNVAMKHVNETAVPAIEVNPKISPALSRIVEKCMNKNPDYRYNDFNELRRDLLRAMEDPRGDYVLLQTDANEDMPTQHIKLNNDINGKEKNNEHVQKESSGRIWQLFGLIALTILIVSGVFYLISFIIESRETGTIKVPGVVGMSRTDAENTIISSNLNISFEEVYSDNVPQGYVISQEPAENTSVLRDHIIKVYVSKGKAPPTAEPKFSVPNLIGLTREEAIKRIEEEGFAIGYITQVQSDRGIGTVTWQNPTSVEQMTAGSVINIKVSQGRTIPNLVGMTVDQARDILAEIGFDVGNISYVDQEGTSGRIITQTPAAETVIDVEKQGKPYIEVSVVYYKAVLEFDTSIFASANEIKVIYFENGNEVIETVFELTPDSPPPESINVLAKQPGTRTYHILVDGVELDSIDIVFE